MRLMQTLFGLVACSSLALTPAFASQRGHQGAPPAAVHPAPAAKPAAPATAPAPKHVETHEAAKAPKPAATGTPHHTTVTVAQRIAANPALATRLQTLLPSGMTLQTAAAGFKNQGQFIAALHVSRNLNIPFAQLKAAMTGANHDSLGQAIQQLRPTANVKTATVTAEREANEDVKVVKPVKPVKPHHTDRDAR
jgi:hypothetical protein